MVCDIALMDVLRWYLYYYHYITCTLLSTPTIYYFTISILLSLSLSLSLSLELELLLITTRYRIIGTSVLQKSRETIHVLPLFNVGSAPCRSRSAFVCTVTKALLFVGDNLFTNKIIDIIPNAFNSDCVY